jgi:hypothetical protein
MDSSGSRQEPVAGSCERSNKPFNSIKGVEFLHKVNDYNSL